MTGKLLTWAGAVLVVVVGVWIVSSGRIPNPLAKSA